MKPILCSRAAAMKDLRAWFRQHLLSPADVQAAVVQAVLNIVGMIPDISEVLRSSV